MTHPTCLWETLVVHKVQMVLIQKGRVFSIKPLVRKGHFWSFNEKKRKTRELSLSLFSRVTLFESKTAPRQSPPERSFRDLFRNDVKRDNVHRKEGNHSTGSYYSECTVDV